MESSEKIILWIKGAFKLIFEEWIPYIWHYHIAIRIAIIVIGVIIILTILRKIINLIRGR